LSKAPGASITLTPLLSTSDQSGLIPVDEVKEPHPAQILARFKPQGGPRIIAARVRGMLKSAFPGPPPLAKDQKRPDHFPAHITETAKPASMVVVADSDILADRFWVRISDFFGQPTATPFADNGPFVANLVGTLSGSDALIGLRSRGDTNRPFTLVADMQAHAEAQFRQKEQALQTHLTDVQKQIRSLRTGAGPGSGPDKADAAITPEQRAAIDAAQTDILETRRQLRAVQLDLNRDINRLETETRIVTIIAVPAVLTVLAIGIGLMQRRRRARARR
jgi:ABC-type uncharacterized transport system involved in gliding motility auxiliary subunit